MKKSLLKKLESYEAACAALGQTPLTIEAFSSLPEHKRQSAFSRERIETIVEAGKEGKDFDWNDYGQRKWFPYFDMETYNDGRVNDGFQFYDVYYNAGFCHVGSRLCSFEADIAEYIAKTHIEDYKNFMK